MPVTKTRTIVPTQLSVENEPPEDLIKHVDQLFEEREENWFKLCIALSRIYDGELHAVAGFRKFSDYVHERCPVNYRTAMWAVMNGQKIRKLHITQEEVSKIGFSKFKEICSLMSEHTTKDEALDLIDKVKALSFRETVNWVKEEKLVTEGGEVVRYVTMSFKLRGEAAEIVNSALETAKDYFNTETLEDALENICQDWDLNRDPKKSSEFKEFLEAKRTAIPKETKKKKHRKHNKAGQGGDDVEDDGLVAD